MPDTLTVLREARSLIARGLAKRAFARDAEGNAVDVDDPSADSWCLIGAASRAAGRDRERLAAAMRELDALCPGANASAWVDRRGTTQAEALGLMDRAISRLEE